MKRRNDIDMTDRIIEALRVNFEGQIEKHLINVENLIENRVGIGEHGDIMDEIENEISKIADYKDKLEIVEEYLS
jgi:hypothetical protein